MWHREFDLQVGESIQIGSKSLIVVETHDGEVTFKVCATDELLDEPPEWSGGPPKK